MVNICRICLGNVFNVSSDDMKNDGTSEKFLVKQDQTDSEDEEKTLFQDTFRFFIVNLFYNENGNLNKVLIFCQNFLLQFFANLYFVLKLLIMVFSGF